MNDVTAPNVKIEKMYYINLNESVERNKQFLENYKKYNTKIPFERFSAIKSTKAVNKVKKGELGCSLSHMVILDKISKSKPGWYLVCEDDCVGDLNSISTNIYLRNIIKYRREKKYINLFTREPEFKDKKYDLNITGWNTSSYIVTPEGANIAKNIIRNNIYLYPCDRSIEMYTKCNIGALVNILKISGMASDIKRININ